MSDIYDQASDAEELHRADAIARQRGAPGPDLDWRTASAKWCAGDACGVRIHDARRRAIPGVQLCIDCQSTKEQREKRNR